jgi:hypothetical protein
MASKRLKSTSAVLALVVNLPFVVCKVLAY